jgi:hypothetical protein
MDHYSILEEAPSLLPPPSELGPWIREREQDAGQSLAEMARADLDAALQLLADRAQYITGASGAAIALRRGEQNTMLCRASTGSNAPGLGSLLSTDHGVSGECVRTRRPLRCDDAQQDPRVDRKVCIDLGIASLVVMPIMSGDNVLGVFELFSGKPRAFEDRDLSTLMRLSQLAETAVNHAIAAQNLLEILEVAVRENPALGDEGMGGPEQVVTKIPLNEEFRKHEEINRGDASPKRTLLWSAALRAQADALGTEQIATTARKDFSLQICQACGFPVSQDRALCVECEEKRWRGQPILPASGALSNPVPQKSDPVQVAVMAKDASVGPAADTTISPNEPAPPELHKIESQKNEAPVPDTGRPTSPVEGLAGASAAVADAGTFSSVLPCDSWFDRNKSIVAALLVIAVIAAVVWLR